MPNNIKELLAGVRAKYPGAYDNMPDSQLMLGIKAKYPGAYDHLIDPALGFISSKDEPVTASEVGSVIGESLKGVGRKAWASGGGEGAMAGVGAVAKGLLGPAQPLMDPSARPALEASQIPIEPIKAIAAGKNPISPDTYKDKQPSFSESAIKALDAWGVKGRIAKGLLGTTAGVLMDLGANALVYGAATKGADELVGVGKKVYGKAQNSAFTKLATQINDIFLKAGIEETAAKEATERVMDRAMLKSSPMSRTPWRIAQTTKQLADHAEPFATLLEQEVASRNAAPDGTRPTPAPPRFLPLAPSHPLLSGPTNAVHYEMNGGQLGTIVNGRLEAMPNLIIQRDALEPQPTNGSKVEPTQTPLPNKPQEVVSIPATKDRLSVIKALAAKQKGEKEVKPSLVIPEFKNSGEAIQYGKDNGDNPQVIPALQKAIEALKPGILEAHKTGDFQNGMDLATQKQFYTEAVNAAKAPSVVAGVKGLEVLNGKIADTKIGERGSVLIPDINVEPLKKFVEGLSPVRSSPRDVNRAINNRDIEFNLNSYNVDQLKQHITGLVPDAGQREIITHYIESGGTNYIDKMTPEMLRAAKIISTGQEFIGRMAFDRGILRNYLENYMKHMTTDPDITPEEISAKIRWAVSTGKISKFVESKLPRARTQDGEILFPTIEALEKAGIPVVTKDAASLFEYTLRSQSIAIANDNLFRAMRKIPYTDPKHPTEKLFQVIRVSPGDRVPNGYRLLRRGVFTQSWASPEAYHAISSIAEPMLGSKPMSVAASISKRIKFLVPFFHQQNFLKSAVMATDPVTGLKLFAEGAKLLENPDNVRTILSMGVNLFRVNKLAGEITDEIQGFSSNNYLNKKLEALGNFTFIGMGDNLAAGISTILKERFDKNPNLSEQEAHEMVAEITNNLTGNISTSSMGRGLRDIGRILLLARNWTLSNLRIGTGALKITPKGWSKAQSAQAARVYQEFLLKGFATFFAGAQLINYATTKAAYGKGRFTWENEGDWQKKIQPILWIDKKTGTEYHNTNWYGVIGDIMHWATDPGNTLANKASIPFKEMLSQIVNRDLHTGDQIARDSDSIAEMLGHRFVHAASAVVPAGVTLDKGAQRGIPPAAMQILGFSLGKASRSQDALDTIYKFKEKNKYSMQDTRDQVLKAISLGDMHGAISIAAKEQDPEMFRSALRSYEHPAKYAYDSLSGDDKRKLIASMDRNKREKFFHDIFK